MKNIFAAGLLFTLCVMSAGAADKTKPVALFDGKTFKGWEGDTNKTWRIEDGSFVGGNFTAPVPHNEFICTQRQFTNFVLRVKFKLVGVIIHLTLKMLWKP